MSNRTNAADADQRDVEHLLEARHVRSFEGIDATRFKHEVESSYEPAILRQLVTSWPAVAAGRLSADDVAQYLSSRDNGTRVAAFLGYDNIEGRYFYKPDVESFNFTPAETTLSKSAGNPSKPSGFEPVDLHGIDIYEPDASVLRR